MGMWHAILLIPIGTGAHHDISDLHEVPSFDGAILVASPVYNNNLLHRVGEEVSQ